MLTMQLFIISIIDSRDIIWWFSGNMNLFKFNLLKILEYQALRIIFSFTKDIFCFS